MRGERNKGGGRGQKGERNKGGGGGRGQRKNEMYIDAILPPWLLPKNEYYYSKQEINSSGIG